MTKHKYIVLFTHGYNDGNDKNGIYLYDQKLDIHDIAQLKLSAELVALCSCNSGIGEAKPGGSVNALNRAFILVGASNVVYSLIDVDEKCTINLLKDAGVQVKKGLSYSRAIRNAQLKMIKKKGYDPFDWCGYTLLGNI